MNASSIIGMLNNQADLGADHYVQLSELSSKYPWFPAIHILQAKCLHNQNKYGFRQALKKAALYTGNREVLYDVIHGYAPNSELTKMEEAKAEPEAAVLPTEPTSEPSDIAIAKSEQPDLNLPEVVLPEKITTELVESASIIKSDTKSKEKVEIPAPVYDPTVELLKLVKTEAHPTENRKDIKKKEVKKEVDFQDHKHDFLSWLDSFSEPAKPQKVSPKKLPMSDEARQLLDNFIKNRPSVRRLNAGFYNPADVAAKSDEEDSDWVSEALAGLYLKQELPQKAIEVYKKLQLQMPQKFSYFAALIRKVRQEHNLSE